jgi:SAM-dependent methyltransferase
LDEESRVIDFVCGYGRSLALWAKDFGVSGSGIEIHTFLCHRAEERMVESGLTDRVDIICANALDYPVSPGIYDVAGCFGASFIWGGYQAALCEMKKSLKPDGKIVVGNPITRKKMSQSN